MTASPTCGNAPRLPCAAAPRAEFWEGTPPPSRPETPAALLRVPNASLNVYDLSETSLDDDLRILRTRLAKATVFILAVSIVGTIGFRVIHPQSGWIDAFYMTAITLSSVGFGEIVPLDTHPYGRLFTTVLILVGMGAVLYFVTTATAFVIEGQLGHVFRRRQMKQKIREMSNHLIVCGSGQTAVYAARELLAVERKVLLVCDRPDRLKELSASLPDVPIIAGDPGKDSVLHAANIEQAAGLVAASDNDRENLVVTLSARQISGNLRIVTRVTDLESVEKVRRVGADAVVSPPHIGGLRLASELIRPTVVSFLDVMLRDRDRNLRVDEVEIPSSSSYAGKTLGDLEVEEVSNAMVLALKRPDGGWDYNPDRAHPLDPGSVLILMGTPSDARAVSDRVGGDTRGT